MKDIEEALKSGEEIAAGFIEDVEQIVQAMEEEAETKSAWYVLELSVRFYVVLILSKRRSVFRHSTVFTEIIPIK